MKGLAQAGFSLLEILVTLFVIVLVTSLVSLSVGSGGQGIKLEATVRNLADVAAYAVDEAQLTGRNYGLLLQRDVVGGAIVYSYHWREGSLQGWRLPESGKEVFASHTLPPGIDLQLELDGSAFSEQEVADTAEEERPQVYFYASGETTAGSIDVLREDDGELLWRLRWDLLGRFELLPGGKEPDIE